MPLLADFLPKVYEITDRPDLVAETTTALTRALQQAHFSSFFNFDVQQEVVANPGEQTFSVVLPARFRSVRAIYTDTLFTVKEIPPAAIFDNRVFMEKQNCYYIAGANIQFRLTSSWSTLVHQYFQIPAFADSYLATNHEHIIVQLAAAKVF